MGFTVKIDPSGALLCVQQVYMYISYYVDLFASLSCLLAFKCSVWHEYCCTVHLPVLSFDFLIELCHCQAASVSLRVCSCYYFNISVPFSLENYSDLHGVGISIPMTLMKNWLMSSSTLTLHGEESDTEKKRCVCIFV